MDGCFPITLSLQGKCCIIAGIGAVGERKLKRILDCSGDATILLFDPYRTAPPPFCDGHPHCIFHCRRLEEEDVKNADLVFACTADPAENARIAALCKKHRVLCNSASNPADGDFSLPALLSCDGITISLSTQGASPALAKKWRKELELWAHEKTALLAFMARLRPRVLALGRPSAENAALFTRLAESPLELWLHNGEKDRAVEFLLPLLPAELHNALPELLYDLL